MGDIAVAMLPQPLEGRYRDQPVRVIGLLQVSTDDTYYLVVRADGKSSWVGFEDVELSRLYAAP